MQFKKVYLKYLAIVLLLFCSASQTQAQLTIDDNVTAAALVDKLVGSGVVTLNPTLTCKTGCSATFGGTSNLGIDSGIILVTGRAKTTGSSWGVDAVATSEMNSNGFGAGDADLSALMNGGVTNNACVLEFDFIPAGDTVKFEYVFGSEEYPEYACSGYNDVFAFLISGPGIVPNFPSLPTKRNIALVPGTTNIPIAINTVNSGAGVYGQLSNCQAMGGASPYTQYYVNNLNPVGQHVVFDGFTTVLTAIQAVVPCDTYRLKLAVADIMDGSLNSGVFIKAGSLSSPVLTAGAQGMNVTASDTAFIVRGCPSAEVTISREVATSVPLVVPYSLSGTAINGYDYEYLTGTVTIPADSTVGRVTVKALPLPNPSPNKYVEIKFLAPYNCNGNPVVLDSAVVSIQDSILVSASIGPDTAICFGQQLEIDLVTDTIFGPVEYEWIPNTNVLSPTVDYANIVFENPGMYEYQFRIRIPSQDTNCRASTASFRVEVQNIDVNIGADSSICSYDRLQMFAEVNPQDTGGSYQYTWSPAEIFENPNSVAPVIKANSYSAQVVAIVRTDIGCVGRDTMQLTVNPGEFVSVLPSDTAICPADTVRPVIVSTLPNTPVSPDYQYTWSPSNELEFPNRSIQAFSPQTTTTYRLLAKNQFGCTDTSFVHVEVYTNAVAQVPDSVVLWQGETYEMEPTTNAVHFDWFPVSGISNSSISNPIFYPEVNTRYFYTAKTEQGCVLKDSVDFIVKLDGVSGMPNAFNPNTELFKPNFRGRFALEQFEIYDRWGTLVYQGSDLNQGWNGTVNNQPAPLGVYVYVLKLRNLQSGSLSQKTGNVTLLR